MPLGLTLGGFFFCTSKTDVTAPQQCGAATAFSSSFNRVNGVGYSTTDNSAEDTSFIFGAPFSGIATKGVISFKDLACPQDFEDDDQIQTAYTDENGITRLYGYVYFGEWYNEDMDPLAETDSIAAPGTGFWLILNDASETFSEVSPLAKN